MLQEFYTGHPRLLILTVVLSILGAIAIIPFYFDVFLQEIICPTIPPPDYQGTATYEGRTCELNWGQYDKKP